MFKYIGHIVKTQKALEWCGSLTGLAGAALLATNSSWSGYGFLLFLVSNVAWITYAIKTRMWSMITMQVGFTATSLLGISRWIM